jgi:hypothetical protein
VIRAERFRDRHERDVLRTPSCRRRCRGDPIANRTEVGGDAVVAVHLTNPAGRPRAARMRTIRAAANERRTT